MITVVIETFARCQLYRFLYLDLWNFSWMYLLWDNFCRRYCEWQGCIPLIFSGGEAKWCNLLLHLTNAYVWENFGGGKSPDFPPLVAGLASGKVVRYKSGMNVRIYLLTDGIVSIVDTRLRLPTETLLKRMQHECNFNFITNGWAKFVTRCGWASPIFPGLRKQHQITLKLLCNSNFPCNVRGWLWNPVNG